MHLKVKALNDVYEESQSSEFVRIYDNCRNSETSKFSVIKDEKDDESSNLGKVEIKLTRLNTLVIAEASVTDTSVAAFSTRLTILPIPTIREKILL